MRHRVGEAGSTQRLRDFFNDVIYSLSTNVRTLCILGAGDSPEKRSNVSRKSTEIEGLKRDDEDANT